jgi:hypothetical protein
MIIPIDFLRTTAGQSLLHVEPRRALGIRSIRMLMPGDDNAVIGASGLHENELVRLTGPELIEIDIAPRQHPCQVDMHPVCAIRSCISHQIGTRVLMLKLKVNSVAIGLGDFLVTPLLLNPGHLGSRVSRLLCLSGRLLSGSRLPARIPRREACNNQRQTRDHERRHSHLCIQASELRSRPNRHAGVTAPRPAGSGLAWHQRFCRSLTNSAVDCPGQVTP